MHSRARRQPARALLRFARRVLLMSCLFLPSMAVSDPIISAAYTGPTTRYPHGVLGDTIEHETLSLTLQSGETRTFTLPKTLVFEDTHPRLYDLDMDGAPEVITVESDAARGARLAIYTARGRLTTTPFIGTRFRWLAPLGAADLDRDGAIEIAYVDRPHLAKTLRIWRFSKNTLTELATYTGVTNHRIGERDIAGGIRDCGAGPEMILADAQWRRLIALKYDGSKITSREIARDTRRAAFSEAMQCPDD